MPAPAVVSVEHTTPDKTTPSDNVPLIFGPTNQRSDGNRVVSGSGGTFSQPLDIPLKGSLVWITTVPFYASTIWYAVLESVQVQAFQVNGSISHEIESTPAMLPAVIPSVLIADSAHAYLSPAPSNTASAIVLPDGSQAYLDESGSLQFNHYGTITSLPATTLLDVRILSDSTGRLLFLSHPIAIYPHGTLGDKLEASRFTLVDTTANPHETKKFNVADGDVIDGVVPILVDLNLENSREIIVTQSNTFVGSQLVVYREDGKTLAENGPIGKGFRRMHQIAAADFIQGGPIEIAADLHGDGVIELIIPSQAQTNLSGIQFNGCKLIKVWNVPLDAQLISNLIVVRSEDGHLALGAGTENQVLRLWNTQ